MLNRFSNSVNRTVISCLFVFLLPFSLNLEASEVITVQGQVTDTESTYWNGLLDIQFAIYDAPTQGNDLWKELLQVEVLNGIFTVVLGTQQPIDDRMFATAERWLGISIGDAGEQLQRYRVTTSPVAIHAHVAEALPPGSIDGSRLEAGAITPDKLAACEPGQIIAMGSSGWTCKSPGVNP